MEIIVASRQLTAGAALDMAFDVGLDRPKIVTIEEWTGSQAYLLTHGPMAYRRTEVLRPGMSLDHVRNLLEKAKATGKEPVKAEQAPKLAPERVPQATKAAKKHRKGAQ